MRAFPYQDNDMNSYSTTDTNWRDVFYGTGTTFLTNVSLNGGTQKSDYYLSGQYFLNNGTVKGNTQQRLSLRSNLGFQLNKKLKLSVDLSASYNDNDLFALGREYYQLLPIFSPYNADGTYRLYNKVVDGIDGSGNPIWRTQRFVSNSVAERDQNLNNQKAWFLHSNFTLAYDVMKGLKYTAQLAYDYQSTLEEIVAAAKAQKLAVLGFSSHMAWPFCMDCQIAPNDCASYFSAVRELAQKEAPALEILAGTEAEYISGITSPDKALYAQFKPDFIIGSGHYIFSDIVYIAFDCSKCYLTPAFGLLALLCYSKLYKLKGFTGGISRIDQLR